MKHTCPTCGSDVSSFGDRVVLLENRTGVVVDGRTIRLTSSGTDLVEILWNRYPRTVRLTDIIAALYATREPEGAAGCIRVFVTRARNSLKGTALNISNIFGTGYTLKLGPVVES